MSKSISTNLKNALALGSTSLARLYVLTTTAGSVLRFTDHDTDISYGGNTYYADSGIRIAAIYQTSTRSIQATEVEVIFKSGFIEEIDCIRGVYDSASLVVKMIDYNNTAYGELVLMNGIFGAFENTYKGYGSFEFTSNFIKTNKQIGEVYSPECRADLGDTRCKVDLSAVNQVLTVTTISSRTFFNGTVGVSVGAGYFVNGICTWLTGDNAGKSMEILTDTLPGTTRSMRLVLPMPRVIQVGDTCRVYRGCDKRIDTCATVFNNAVNFRGEPSVPGADYANGIPVQPDGPR